MTSFQESSRISEARRGSSDVSSNSSKGSSTRQAPRTDKPNVIVRFVRSTLGYRKTSLSFFVLVTLVITVIVAQLNNSIDFSVSLPYDELESRILYNSWRDLQILGGTSHTYGSHGNDEVHDFLQNRIGSLIEGSDHIEYDNDLNYTNNAIFASFYDDKSVAYYESNNLLVRINGSDESLPALLVSAHYDSVPSSYGVTDDGMGIASMLGLLEYFSDTDTGRPLRTIILNFNNDEEFGLYGARAFLNHPWFKKVSYFLNLEGAGSGGKAALFRGTDYGIIKYFSGVRYPYGNSIFQEGFNNNLVGSETDYKVYKEYGGLRGLDLSFYKPRDLYHTPGDNIKNINIKSLWHMLSSTLDFSNNLVWHEIDLDSESVIEATKNKGYASYASIFNYFFVFPSSVLVMINILSLVLVPLTSLPLLVIVFNYKRNWNVGFINFVKYPVSLLISTSSINLFIQNFVSQRNKFLPTSSYLIIIFTSVSIFLLLNYLVLNTINLLFKRFKVRVHDEKLIAIIQNSFIYWLILLYSTIKLSNNKIGNDHTGEYSFLLLFWLQSIAAYVGLLGWAFKSTSPPLLSEDYNRPLLVENERRDYGSNSSPRDSPGSSSSSLVIVHNPVKNSIQKSFSYDWSFQFFVIVPLSSFIIYNAGWLVLDALTKTIQESYLDEYYIYKFIEGFSISWMLPLLPFAFKLNRIVVLVLVIFAIQGLFQIALRSPFDQSNPMKLRFLQAVDLSVSDHYSYVNVQGRDQFPIREILEDIPSFKNSNENLTCRSVTRGSATGLKRCAFKSKLTPNLLTNVTDFDDYVQLDVLRNSTNSYDNPFGLVSGEFILKVPSNRICNLNFNLSKESTEISTTTSGDYNPVRNVIVYADKSSKNSSHSTINWITGVPEGYSQDEYGNHIFRDDNGIKELKLNRLDWDSTYHVGLQWVPSVVESRHFRDTIKLNNLGVGIQCFWSDQDKKSKSIGESIPAWRELSHYSPNYVSWSNLDSGLFSVSKYIEL